MMIVPILREVTVADDDEHRHGRFDTVQVDQKQSRGATAQNGEPKYGSILTMEYRASSSSSFIRRMEYQRYHSSAMDW